MSSQLFFSWKRELHGGKFWVMFLLFCYRSLLWWSNCDIIFIPPSRLLSLYTQQHCGDLISYSERAKVRQQREVIMQNICQWSVVCWESVGESKSGGDIEPDCGIAGMFFNDVYVWYCVGLFSTAGYGSCYIRMLQQQQQQHKNMRIDSSAFTRTIYTNSCTVVRMLSVLQEHIKWKNTSIP